LIIPPVFDSSRAALKLKNKAACHMYFSRNNIEFQFFTSSQVSGSHIFASEYMAGMFGV